MQYIGETKVVTIGIRVGASYSGFRSVTAREEPPETKNIHSEEFSPPPIWEEFVGYLLFGFDVS